MTAKVEKLSFSTFVRSVAWVAASALLLSGCGDSLEQFGGPTMGSTYTVKYVRAYGQPKVDEVRPQVEAILAEVDEQMSTYREDSLISRFNRLPANQCMTLPDSMLTLVDYGLALSRLSDGAFDLTLEPLLDLWGFGPRGKGLHVPAQAELDEVRQRVGYQHLRRQDQQLCKDAAVELDLNSIAAGYTVDRIGAYLQGLGIHSYLVEATGELKAVGRKPDGKPWRVAIEAPRDDRQVAQEIVELDGYGVSTSGDYRNYFEDNGQRYSHTFDPRLAAPIAHDLASVTILHPSTLQAEGLSTLLLVLGAEQGFEYAQREQVAAVFVIRRGESFEVRLTPAYEAAFGSRGEQR